MTSFDDIAEQLTPDIINAIMSRFGISILVGILLWITHSVIVFLAKRHIKKHDTLYTTRKISRYIHFLLAAFIIGPMWFKGIRSLGTFLGLFTAGLAIALKDVVTNFAGWVYVLWQAPFRIGDRVQIEDHQGDVIDIGVFKFTLLEIGNWVDANQSTGRMIRIPNADIFNKPIANYSKGFNYIWDEIPITVTSESNWKQAKSILLTIITDHCKSYEDTLKEALQKAKRDYPINYTYITPTIYTSGVNDGVCLTVRYLVATRRIRQSRHELWEQILDAFDDAPNIDIAYPTFRHINDGPTPFLNQ